MLAMEYLDQGVGKTVDDSWPRSLKEIVIRILCPRLDERFTDFSVLREHKTLDQTGKNQPFL